MIGKKVETHTSQKCNLSNDIDFFFVMNEINQTACWCSDVVWLFIGSICCMLRIVNIVSCKADNGRHQLLVLIVICYNAEKKTFFFLEYV